MGSEPGGAVGGGGGKGGRDFIVPEGQELVDRQESVGVAPSNYRCWISSLAWD